MPDGTAYDPYPGQTSTTGGSGSSGDSNNTGYNWSGYSDWLAKTKNSTKTCNLIVNYYANGYNGSAAENPPPSSVRSYTGQAVDVSLVVDVATGETMSNPGYVFVGWATSNDTSTVSYNPGDTISAYWAADYRGNSVTNLYAVWTNQNVITYNPDDNSIEQSSIYQVKQSSQSVTLKGATFTRTGYTQTGWATTAGGPKVYNLGGTYSSDDALSLYPVWQANTYTITYIANQGTGTMAVQTITYDSTFTPSECAFTREGYSFFSWNESADGKGIRWKVQEYTVDRAEDIILYAIWKGNEYSVRYEDNYSRYSEELTGDVVTFESDYEQPLKKASVALTPTQDLHGYSKPWAPGAGKNLYSPSWAVSSGTNSTVTANGEEIHVVTTGGTTYTGMASQSAHDLPAGTYYVKFKVKTDAVTGTGGICGLRRRSNNVFITPTSFSSGTLEYSFSVTTTEACYFSVLGNGGSTGDSQASDFTLYDLIISTENVDYEPYENVCPITGRTGVSVYRFGKNLYDKTNLTGLGAASIAQINDGIRLTSISNGTYRAAYGGFNPHDKNLPDGTVLTFSAHCKVNSGKARLGIRRLSDNNIVANSSLVSSGEADLSITYTYDKSVPVYISVFCTWSTSEAGDVEYTNIQLEIGSTVTSYEPYAGDTYTEDWTSVAGTVYGGSFDPVTGALSSTMANIASYNGETIGEPWLSSMDEYSPGATPTTGAQVVYTLTTPVEYQLTPTQVSVLAATNNVWSNGGQISIVYAIDEVSQDMPASTAVFGDTFYTRRNQFARFGLTFKGWNEAADGSGETWLPSGVSMGTYKRTEDAVWNVSHDVTLYAQWDPYTYPYGTVFFNGRNAKDLGIIVEELPSYYYAERAFNHKQVNGKNGDVILDTGRYENVKKVYKVACYDPSRNFYESAVALSTFLHSAGSEYIRLEDSYEPTSYRMAIYEETNEIENLLGKAGRCEITFNCMPQRFLLSGDEEIAIPSSGYTIYNPTAFDAKPMIRIQGTGTVTINGRSVQVTENDNDMLVDCENQNAKDLSGADMNYFIYCDEFPVLKPGFNTVTFDETIDAVKITPRWWIL